MRAAPAVDVALDPARRERMLIILLHAAAGAVVATWAQLWAGSAAVWPGLAVALLASVLLAAAGAALARRALPPAAGGLRWDGQGWHWLPPAGGAAQPLLRLTVAIDLGPWLLLRLQPGAAQGPVWRVASAGAAGASWHGLRVALAAHAGVAATLRPRA